MLSWTDTGYQTEAVVPAGGTLHSALFPGLNLTLSEVFGEISCPEKL